jgi:hypothetical protein
MCLALQDLLVSPGAVSTADVAEAAPRSFSEVCYSHCQEHCVQ